MTTKAGLCVAWLACCSSILASQVTMFMDLLSFCKGEGLLAHEALGGVPVFLRLLSCEWLHHHTTILFVPAANVFHLKYNHVIHYDDDTFKVKTCTSSSSDFKNSGMQVRPTKEQ